MRILLTLLMLYGLSAHAYGGYGRGGGYGYDRGYGRGGYQPNVRCTAADSGWEEHFFGHADCNDCTRKHGRCVETCEASYTECTATGTDRRGGGSVVAAIGAFRYQAEQEALNRCYYSGLRNCQISNCADRSETVSQRACPANNKPKPKKKK